MSPIFNLLYVHTVAGIRGCIQGRYPLLRENLSDLSGSLDLENVTGADSYAENERRLLCQHILWMLSQISKMGPPDAKKAARWIGWCLAYMEVMGFMTNAQSRDWVRADVGDGYQ
jgi:hypothetical protein